MKKTNKHLKQRLQLLAGLNVKPGNLAFQIQEGKALLTEKKKTQMVLENLS